MVFQSGFHSMSVTFCRVTVGGAFDWMARLWLCAAMAVSLGVSVPLDTQTINVFWSFVIELFAILTAVAIGSSIHFDPRSPTRRSRCLLGLNELRNIKPDQHINNGRLRTHHGSPMIFDKVKRR